MNILIVDDIATNRKLLGAILEAEGHAVVEATDGIEALEVLERENVDAIISDILMPRMDGYRFCYEVRASDRFRLLPFIFYTSSYTSSSDEKLALEMGADKFLTKPAPASKIIEALGEATTRPRSSSMPTEPSRELDLMKEYSQQLVAKLEQKYAELTASNEALLNSQQQLLLQSTALETAANAVVITDTKGTILWVNLAFTTLTGYSSDEVMGKTPRLLKSGKHDRDYYKSLWATILAGKTWRGNFTNRRKDGSLYHDEHTITPVRSKDGPITNFVAIMNDVTERKQAEVALVESEGRFRLLAENITDVFWISTPDFQNIHYVSPAYERIWGSSAESLYANPHEWSGAILPEDRERVLELFTTIRESKLSVSVEYRIMRPDGTVRWIHDRGFQVRDATGQLMCVTGIATDITERKRTEVQIAEQASFLDKAQDAIVVRDLDGGILYWNHGAERMYGWTREEVMGRNVGSLLYPAPRKFEELSRLALNQGEWSGELQHVTKDKRELSIQARWTLVKDNEGRPKSMLAINTDITEKKKIEAQFMRAQRMESIGTLAGGVAHDLNNILAPIMMSIDILKSTADDPQAKKILETIEISAKRGADIVRQVLSFARGLEGERIEVQPKHLLKDLENIIKDTFPKDIRLEFSIPNDTWTILGDPTQVHQVLLNLCVNARDAMPYGGTLAIGVENSTLDEQYVAMNIQARPGRYVKISVTDSGTGIPPAVLDKIFEPFFTTKELNKGTGLGLSTVMAIVKSHEGVINVYSEPGRGTTFKVYLPAMAVSTEARQEQSEQANLPRGNGETVLVIDDEASILTITCQTLQAFGYRVLTATDGADAMTVYTQHKDEIAVVLTDMMMPLMDGPATIHALTRINPAIKIVATSGLNSNGGAAKASGAGVKHFLTKPYTAGALLKTLRSILDEG